VKKVATYAEQMQQIFSRYQAEFGEEPADPHDVAEWAIRNGQWQPRPSDIRDRFAKDLSDALRQEFRTDTKGRNYRAKHAVRLKKNGKQMSLWADIDSAPRRHMEKAFGQRRRQIVGDCYQLRQDVDHYNDTNPETEGLQLILDFTDDVEEKMAADGIGDYHDAA